MSGTADEIAAVLLDTGAFLVRPEAPFRLTSGLYAPFYVNCRLILSRPEARSRAAAALADTVPQPGATVIAGGVTAGVPFATLVADRLGAAHGLRPGRGQGARHRRAHRRRQRRR